MMWEGKRTVLARAALVIVCLSALGSCSKASPGSWSTARHSRGCTLARRRQGLRYAYGTTAER